MMNTKDDIARLNEESKVRWDEEIVPTIANVVDKINDTIRDHEPSARLQVRSHGETGTSSSRDAGRLRYLTVEYSVTDIPRATWIVQLEATSNITQPVVSVGMYGDIKRKRIASERDTLAGEDFFEYVFSELVKSA